jgi:hypothetical protein
MLRVKMQTRWLWVPPSRPDAPRRDAVLHVLRATPRCGPARTARHLLVPMLRVGMRSRTLCVLPLDADPHAPRATFSSRCSASGCGPARSACYPSMRTRTHRAPPSRPDAPRRDAVLHVLRATPRCGPARTARHLLVPMLRVGMRSRTLCVLPLDADPHAPRATFSSRCSAC